MGRLRAALPLLLLLAAGGVVYASGLLDTLHPTRLAAHQEALHAQIARHPWLSRCAYVGLLTLAVATGLPGSVIIIFAGGLAFGVVEGTALSSFGLTFGSLLLFLASRYAFGCGSRQPPALVARLHRDFARHPRGYALFLRFLPVAPFGLVTLCLAWLRCPLWLFLGATWLGGTVMLVFESSIGAGLGEALRRHGQLEPALLLQPQILAPLGAIALLALLALIVQRRRRAPGD